MVISNTFLINKAIYFNIARYLHVKELSANRNEWLDEMTFGKIINHGKSL